LPFRGDYFAWKVSIEGDDFVVRTENAMDGGDETPLEERASLKAFVRRLTV